MSSVIEQLLEDMITECSSCQGSGELQKENWHTGEITEHTCTNCDGEGKTISWEGEQLIQIIKTGEVP